MNYFPWEDTSYEVSDLGRFYDLRAFFLNRRWQVRVYAFGYDPHYGKKRWRPAPYVLNCSIFSWHGRANSLEDAHSLGDRLRRLCIEEDAKYLDNHKMYQ